LVRRKKARDDIERPFANLEGLLIMVKKQRANAESRKNGKWEILEREIGRKGTFYGTLLTILYGSNGDHTYVIINPYF
jgi:hypothetical protein